MEKILRRIPGAINQIRIPSGFATKTYSEDKEPSRNILRFLRNSTSDLSKKILKHFPIIMEISPGIFPKISLGIFRLNFFKRFH